MSNGDMNLVARVEVELRFQAYPNSLSTKDVPYTFTLKAPCWLRGNLSYWGFVGSV